MLYNKKIDFQNRINDGLSMTNVDKNNQKNQGHQGQKRNVPNHIPELRLYSFFMTIYVRGIQVISYQIAVFLAIKNNCIEQIIY